MKTRTMVIIIIFPTLQCLDPWEFAVRLSQQRCPPLNSTALCCAVKCCVVLRCAVLCCVVPCLCYTVLCSVPLPCSALVNPVMLYQLNAAILCNALPSIDPKS